MRIFLTLILLALLSPVTPAQAFCGLYVARAGGELFNEASKVIYAHNGNFSAITMASDYQGEAAEFAMIIPTPKVLRRDQIRTVDAGIMEHLDNYTAPRLVEYHDHDPCSEPVYPSAEVNFSGQSAPEPAFPPRGAKALGVTVKARYAVGEYDIVMLSAKQSDGLETWLTQEGYNIPEGASEALGMYIKMGMKFFVARVNLKRHKAGAKSDLTPIQIRFRSKNFMLPLQLGMVNAKGKQDLILLTLTKIGRVNPTNYRTHEIPSNFNIPIFVRKEFPQFYKDMFTTAVNKIGGTGVMLEYAWDMRWCDPCAADPLSNKDLRKLGAIWIPRFGNDPAEVFVTRLHVRYDADSFSEDLSLLAADIRDNFQGRYVMQHPWAEPFECEAKDYIKEVRGRVNREATTLREHTGWPAAEIKSKILKSMPAMYK